MSIDYYEITMKYRKGLLEKGQMANFENPDRLTLDEMTALTEKIFSEVDKIDCSMGYPHHETGIRRPESISKQDQHELFMDFIDWYQIIKTPSNDILNYVLQKYPAEKFPKILCVGDGKNCHLGRKLAMKGYKVVSVDPVARKEFAGNFKGDVGAEGGRLRVIQGEFHKTSTDMINWADVIVGSKVPMCAEDLVQVNKPTVFNISNNPEIYNMRFKGVPIKSKRQLVRAISRCSGVQVKDGSKNEKEETSIFFVRDERERIQEV